MLNLAAFTCYAGHDERSLSYDLHGSCRPCSLVAEDTKVHKEDDWHSFKADKADSRQIR